MSRLVQQDREAFLEFSTPGRYKNAVITVPKAILAIAI